MPEPTPDDKQPPIIDLGQRHSPGHTAADCRNPDTCPCAHQSIEETSQ